VKQNRFSTKLISSLPRINLDRIPDYFTIKNLKCQDPKKSKSSPGAGRSGCGAAFW
jgi:hypothetical protein